MRVHAIQTGAVAVKSRAAGRQGPRTARLVSTLIDRAGPKLCRSRRGRSSSLRFIVIDTGETFRVADRGGYFPPWQPYFELGARERVSPEELGPMIRALGFSLDDVRWVIMTHLYTDHAGGLSHVSAF